uniref:Odorant receptor n=1 Tax=Meteorus pulchricornis TaxID=51522 RepID=A0A1S5VFQ0_9HYME|nr:olfactory receptor 59 [Meteorus pulchricornis]
MVAHKSSEYHTYRNIIKWLLIMLGLYPLEKAGLFYRSLPYIHVFLNIGTSFGMVGFLRANITNVVVVIKRLGVLVSFLSVALKVIVMIINRNDTKELFITLDVYFNNLINNPRYTKIVTNGMTAFRRLSWTVSILSCLSGIVIIITPVILVIYQHKHHVQPIKFILPNHSIYPWYIEPNGLSYKLHYIFESMATVSLVAVTSSVEPLFTLYVVQMIGRLREMSYCITHFDETNADSVIRECIFQHKILLRCRDLVQTIFGPLILWMVVTNAIILCLGIFQLSQMKTISAGQAIFFIAYVGTKMTQTFICGWTGTRLTAESEDYRAAIYAANWQGNKQHMKSVVIMLSQKPLTLTACHFSTISVDLFVSVLNTTMSYFFLLQTLQHGE